MRGVSKPPHAANPGRGQPSEGYPADRASRCWGPTGRSSRTVRALRLSRPVPAPRASDMPQWDRSLGGPSRHHLPIVYRSSSAASCPLCCPALVRHCALRRSVREEGLFLQQLREMGRGGIEPPTLGLRDASRPQTSRDYTRRTPTVEPNRPLTPRPDLGPSRRVLLPHCCPLPRER